MVLTPNFRPLDPSEPLSPLLLASKKSRNVIRRQSSSGLSISQLSDFELESPALELEDVDDMTNGLRHVDVRLDIPEWKRFSFKSKVLALLQQMKVPRWTSSALQPASIHLQKVSGALTNAVFFVSFNPSNTPTNPTVSPLLTPKMPAQDPLFPNMPSEDQIPPTLLLRIFGPSSGALISRKEELRILTLIGNKYHLGPKIFGTFTNGRVEQFFPSRALKPLEMRDPHVSRCIARRMRELHSVDLRLLGFDHTEPMVWRILREWADLAEDVLMTLETVSEEWRIWVEGFGLLRVREEMEQYRQWVQNRYKSGAVFAHNDAQYGNILKLDKHPPIGVPEHHRYIVIDFEYAAPNPRGYDIANHFHEWRADYHHPTHSHSLRPHFPYPDPQQREAFYKAYLDNEDPDLIYALETEVRMWSPASSAFWCLWGIVQAEDKVRDMAKGLEGEYDFDYLSYAIERVEMFRLDALDLGALSPIKSNANGDGGG